MNAKIQAQIDAVAAFQGATSDALFAAATTGLAGAVDALIWAREQAVAAFLAAPAVHTLSPASGYTLAEATASARALASFREIEDRWNREQARWGKRGGLRRDGWLWQHTDHGALRRQARLWEGVHDGVEYCTLFVDHADCFVCDEHRSRQHQSLAISLL